MTAFMQCINTMNYYGVPYRTLINDNTIVVRYNEYGDDYTEEVFAADGSPIRVVDVFNGKVNIGGMQ